MKALSGLFLAIGALALAGCVGASHVTPSKSEVETAVPDDGFLASYWLGQNRVWVENQIVAYIKSKYPVVPPDVHAFTVGDVRVKNQIHRFSWEPDGRMESVLKDIFQTTADRILLDRPSSGIVVDIEVSVVRPTTSGTEEVAAMVAATPLCLGTMFVACPAKFSRYVVLDATLKKDGAPIGVAHGVGGSTRYVSTVMVDDSGNAKTTGQDEAMSKALAAAIADLGAKLVPSLRGK